MFNKPFRQSNSGFSLVELIVVVMVVAILATGATLSISMVYNSSVEQAAKKLNSTLAQARQEAMSLADDSAEVYAKIYQDADSNWVVSIEKVIGGTAEAILQPKKLGNYKVDVGYGKYTDATEVAVTDAAYLTASGDAVYMFFKKSNGSVQGNLDGGATREKITDLYVKGASRMAHVIVVPETGRCYLYDLE